MTHICIVSPNSYSLFNPQFRFIHGGAELRAWIIGNRLSVEPNYQITFIVLDHGQKNNEMFNKVRVVTHSYHRGPPIPENSQKIHNLKTYIKILKNYINKLKYGVGKKCFFFKTHLFNKYRNLGSKTSKPAITLIDYYICSDAWKVYKQINADIYCIFGNTNLSYEVATFCKKNNKKFILFSASDIDFSEKYQAESIEKDIYGSFYSLCYYSIKNADLIVCQTQYQKKILSDYFNKEGIVISNPISLTNFVDIPSIRPYALWIGKSDTTKQPHILLKIACANPEIPFFLIMHRSNINIHNEIYKNKPNNVTIIEYVPYNEIEHYFAKSFVFINTSRFEGFPNTFLQAGKYGVPILSLQVDPDNFIENYRCGIVAKGDMSKLINGLKAMSTYKWQLYSKNIYNYVLEKHNLDDQVKQLMSAIENFL